jgi:hypothetical protein
MMATSSGAVHLLGGVILSLIPSSPVGVPGEKLDYVGRTTRTPMASLPPWRCRFGSFYWWQPSALLSSESFHLCTCLRLASSALSGLR